MMNEQDEQALKSEIKRIGGEYYSSYLADRLDYLKYKLKKLQSEKRNNDE